VLQVSVKCQLSINIIFLLFIETEAILSMSCQYWVHFWIL